MSTSTANETSKYLKGVCNFDKYPAVNVKGAKHPCVVGWEAIWDSVSLVLGSNKCLVLECYPGVFENEILDSLKMYWPQIKIFQSKDCMKSEAAIEALVEPDVTEDEIFGYMTRLNIESFFEKEAIDSAKKQIADSRGPVLIFGPGASLLADNPDLLVYADMARWEIQQRFRQKMVANLGANNAELKASLKYKRAFFVDWRVCDRLKKKLMKSADFVLDTNTAGQPKLVAGDDVRSAYRQAVAQPFRVVPFFDPGPWGGQWMKEVCDLNANAPNFAWCFDCVPEENSLLLRFGEHLVEVPSINLVFYESEKLLGKAVQARFGDEFPIRFDFLDTMNGGNLSLQVHPTTEYIQEKFGMHYTQDESYYMLDAGEDASVYLGLKSGINSDAMIEDLNCAQREGTCFDAEKYVEKWPAKKHDHFLIPAGTVHCSGANSMVLEISSTPYIFTFKLWDWQRLGLDGKPRPINIEHGKAVIDWSRTTNWVEKELINTVQVVAEGDGWIEERTGLHEREFIETRRHWFSKAVLHNTNGSVNVLNLVEGKEAIVESPTGAFDPLVIHYAETFIVPEAVKEYTIRPYGASEGQRCATIKAFVRTKP